MMAGAGDVYLSLVATARNDDHGGNLLGRMQAFTGGWLAQAKRFGIPSELILVEWNPPADRPRLWEALNWPAEKGPCAVRVVEVPAELHARYRHAAALPLYQMIAKNAGIRRARGQFILATNIDILFSSELAAFFAERKLERGKMYRIDRHDVMSDVPTGADIEEQLAYCRSHLIRVNSREGTFPVTPDGQRALAKEDLAAPGSGVVFGRGWYAVERYSRQEPFRWAGDCAELLMEETGPAVLRMDVEPGPGTGFATQLEITDGQGKRLAQLRLGCRGRLELPLGASAPRQLLFRTRNGAGLAAGNDPRVLNFRTFGVACEKGARSDRVTLRPLGWASRVKSGLGMVDHVAERLATGGEQVALTVPVSGGMRRLFQRYLRMRNAVPAAGAAARNLPIPPLFLHTNGCGDFTLMAREHWFDLRGYAEFDLFSMNIDSLFCAAAHHGGAREEILADPMRIYHIEHGTGSGWTPEGQARLYERLEANGIAHLENDEVLRWAAQMNRLGTPILFNHDNWGLADEELTESSPFDRV
jgi:hypothetical protein